METETVTPPKHIAEDALRGSTRRRPGARELDELRLVALSRIPRCTGCPRLEALQDFVHLGMAIVNPWPPAPGRCRHPICVPMLRRLGG